MSTTTLLLIALCVLLLLLLRQRGLLNRSREQLSYSELRRQRALAHEAPAAAWGAAHFAATPLPVLITDDRRALRAVNGAAVDLFGDAQAGEGLIKRVRHHLLEQLVIDALAGKESRGELVELPSERYVMAWAYPWKQRSGNERGAMLILQEVTEQQRLARSRREMVSNLSHELRTPLTSVKLMTDNLLDGAVQRPEIAARFVQRIAAENEAMILLIEDLTTLSFVESGRMPLRLAKADLRELVAQRIQRLVPLAAQNRVTFEIEAPPTVVIDIDGERIGQVVTNLLHNALKFSPEAGVVRVAIEPSAAEVRLQISDEGSGILPADLSRIFERFYKASRARTRGSSSGTGLGLAIAKHIVEAHGGTISAESRYGHGATFTMLLPRH